MSRRKTAGKIFVLSGPSGSGKTTLHEQVLRDKAIGAHLVKIISATTRAPRAGEKNKQDYFFLSLKQFQQRRETGYFLECKKVFHDYYGTPRKAVEQVLAKGKSVLLCIDVQGAKEVFRKKKPAVGIFVKAPSLTILRTRLRQRKTEDKKNFLKRLSTAQKELEQEKYYDYVIVNKTVPQAVQELKQIIENELTQFMQRRKNGISTP